MHQSQPESYEPAGFGSGTDLSSATDGNLPSKLKHGLPTPNAGYIALAAAVFMLAAMLGIVFERNLVGTLTKQGWGRTLQGVSAALTELKCGIGGFVIDKRIDTLLQTNGFTGNPVILNAIGGSYPQNLQDQKRLQNALDKAKLTDCNTQELLPNASGYYPNLHGFAGEDAGMSTYTLFSFALFGINVPALTYGYFTIVLLSLSLFAISHYRNLGAMVAVALLTVALYLTLISSLFNFTMPLDFKSGPGIDVKDPRFLGTIAAVPLLHVLVTWMRSDYHLTTRDYFVLATQLVILAFAIHLRLSVVWTMLTLPLIWGALIIATIWRGRGARLRLSQWRYPRSILVIATVLAVPCVAQIGINYSYHPFYAAEGDLGHHTFWDGVLQSLEYNPEWTTKHGAVANGATGDELPLSVVLIAIAKLPVDQRLQYLNHDGAPTRIAYEKFSRTAFIDLLAQDPAFVLHTFFVTKPSRIFHTEAMLYQSLFSASNGWHLLLSVATLAVLAWMVAGDAEAVKLLCGVASAAIICALMACLPNWLSIVNELVMFDSLAWGLLFICLATVILAVAVRRLMLRAWLYRFRRSTA